MKRVSIWFEPRPTLRLPAVATKAALGWWVLYRAGRLCHLTWVPRLTWSNHSIR